MVNVWDWDSQWTVEILEGNTPLDVEMVQFGTATEAERRDPLFMATFEYQYFDANKTDAGTFRAGGLSHIFRAQASSATSTVTVG